MKTQKTDGAIKQKVAALARDVRDEVNRHVPESVEGSSGASEEAEKSKENTDSNKTDK